MLSTLFCVILIHSFASSCYNNPLALLQKQNAVNTVVNQCLSQTSQLSARAGKFNVFCGTFRRLNSHISSFSRTTLLTSLYQCTIETQ